MIRRSHGRWLPVLLWVAVIYTTIPFVRRLREFFVARWPGELIAYGVMAVVVAAAVAGLGFLWRRRRGIRVADALWLVGIATILVVWTRHLMGQPEEAVHFLEYGVLGVLLYRALRPRIPDATIFAAGALVGILVGTVDEVIQWVVPDRFWDFRDVALNGGASVLIQVALWRLASRATERVRRPSLRLLCRLAAVQILILTLCFSATPARTARLAERLPGLANPASGTDAICEYGHRHALDNLTVFRSRLTLAELEHADAARAPEVAAVLDASRHAYGDFLATVSPVDDPFAYEARVHLFARDRNLGEGRKLTEGTPARRERMTIAFRENLILESVFGTTLEHSSYRWPERQRARIEDEQDPKVGFVSKVGSHLITAVSENHLRALMLTLLAALLACDLALGRGTATRPRPGARQA
ncbi:MAG: VanZ family protein [Thermoanaerobaculales bacterium]